MKYLIIIAIPVLIIIGYFALTQDSDRINIPETSELNIMQEVQDGNTDIKLTYKNGEYLFKTKAGNGFFKLNSLFFKKTLKGQLEKGFDYIEFTVEAEEYQKVYISYNNVNYYDSNGYYYTLNSEGGKVYDNYRSVSVSKASGKNSYNFRVDLYKYYECSSNDRDNATISLAYLGTDTIKIRDIVYIKNQVEQTRNNLEVVNKGISIDPEFYGIKIISGIIETNVKIDRLWLNCNHLGTFDIEYDESKVYEGDKCIYKYQISAQQLGYYVYDNDTETTLSIYAEHEGQSYKLMDKKVILKGCGSYFNPDWLLPTETEEV